uniref:TBC1 domain-containing protein n=1 Tax=Hucho hucho TaxID=62062 RepID=A0A4W5PW50_9TELE
MLSRWCSCCNSKCSCEPIRSWSRRETAGDVSHLVEDEDQREIVADGTRMNQDIALLREQYNCTKEKQKTRVVLFRQEISGKALVNMVPVNQEMKSTHERKWSVSEAEIDFVRHLETTPWYTHLGIHRRTNDIIALHPNPTITGSNSSSLTSLSEDCSQKFSAPVVLSRQLSFGGQQQPLFSSSPLHHYPFPHRKGPKKSEAARRLGIQIGPRDLP